MSPSQFRLAAPRDLRVRFAERPYRIEDFESLLRIERHAGNARWKRNELAVFVTHLHFDTRVITAPDSPHPPIAFYVVEHGDRTLYLSNLAVAPEWRRQGVAQFALEAAAEFGRGLGYERLALDVQEENLPAQLLYRKAGFRAVRIRPDHYRGQDGYHMVKDLEC